jgi:hypothetical protein
MAEQIVSKFELENISFKNLIDLFWTFFLTSCQNSPAPHNLLLSYFQMENIEKLSKHIQRP